MKNLKKILIVILVLFLILIVRKSNIMERFYDERYLDDDFMEKDFSHADLQSNIYVEFYYKESCAISRQFMYGCCKPYSENPLLNKLTPGKTYSVEKKDPSMVSMSSNSLYDSNYSEEKMHKIQNEVDNPRYDETHCMDHHGNQLKSCFYKTNEPGQNEFNDPIVNHNVPFK